MNYFTVAEDIFYWLSKYQVRQRRIMAKLKEGQIRFVLDHPVEGKVEINQPLSDKDSFRNRGVGLRIAERQSKNIVLNVYDHGGIFDPIDSFVPGEHYATTHFALLGAILYEERKDVSILEKVKQAVEFHLRTFKDEYFFGVWEYHWDFQNFAFLETYRLLQDTLSEEENQQWVRALRTWKENVQNQLTNWVAMRAYSVLLRQKVFHLWLDRIKFIRRRRVVDRAQHADGCYDDDLNRSHPIQYHVFTLALLHRIFLLNSDSKMKKNFLSGVNYFLKFIDPDGCFNYLGRGQEQIFGYAVGIYVLEAAKLMDKKNVETYQFYLEKIWNHLLKFRKDKHFPLVLNGRRDYERFGWYDYHHLTVYNAFLGAWLGLAHLLNPKSSSNRKEQSGEPRVFIEFFEPTRNIIVSQKEYFVALSGGSSDYLSEPGITPLHLWFKDIGWVFSCPGGPSPRKFGKIRPVEHIGKNVFAPIARMNDSEWILPAYKECEDVKVWSDSAFMVMDYGPFILNRHVLFKDTIIVFEDLFEFKGNGILSELRYFNFPVVIDKFKIDLDRLNEVRLLSENGIIRIIVVDRDFLSKDFEVLECIKTAKGLASAIAMREIDFKIRRNKKNFIKFSLSKLSL